MNTVDNVVKNEILDKLSEFTHYEEIIDKLFGLWNAEEMIDVDLYKKVMVHAIKLPCIQKEGIVFHQIDRKLSNGISIKFLVHNPGYISRPGYEVKTCTCGAKHTSFPNRHLKYCDIN